MNKCKEAVRYMISLWDEYDDDKLWREVPDHVGKKFLEAEAELNEIRDTEVLSEFFTKISEQQDCPPEFQKIVNERFWELL